MTYTEENKKVAMYKPTERQKQVRKTVYDRFVLCENQRKKTWRYFNNRSLRDFIDDSEKRMVNYVDTREEQGKLEWQANFAHPVTQNKVTATLAGVALDIPDVRITARDEKNVENAKRAYIMKNLVRHSYEKENKEIDFYFEALESATKGTCIVHDVYQRQKGKRKKVKKYDPTTGEIEHEEVEVTIKDECTAYIVPLLDLYIPDFNIFDIQQQPYIIHVQKMDEEAFFDEYSNYGDSKYVRTAQKDVNDKDLEERYFNQGWQRHTNKEEPIVVMHYYNRFKDEYFVVANGVVLFDGPMLLGFEHKMYPYAKTIYSPFEHSFFYGNSLPNKLLGEQDVLSAFTNMAIDKTYKSMIPSMLIGAENKDDFDLEDPYISLDTKIHVRDINQVKYLESPGVNNADVKMIEMMSRSIDLSSLDSTQQGATGSDATAREVVIANENARKMKGVFYLFLTYLWVQKINLRIMNILTFYTDVELDETATPGEKKKEGSNFRRFVIENTELDNGIKGTLGVRVYNSKEEIPTQEDMTRESERMRNETGQAYKEIGIESTFLHDWLYSVKVLPESLFQKESSLSQAKIDDKLNIMAKVFPGHLQKNQEKLLKQFLIAWDDDPDEFDTSEVPPEEMAMMQGSAEGMQTPPEMQQQETQQPALPNIPV